MIRTKIQYLDGAIVVEEDEPTTLNEITSLVGELEVVKRFVKHLRYHYKNPRVYAEVAERLVPLFPKVDKENDVVYLTRCLRSGLPEAKKIIQGLFDTVAVSEPLVPKGERGGQGKVSQGAMDAAAGYFAKGQEQIEKVTASIESVLIGYEIQRDAENHVTLEGLARGIQRLNRQLVQQNKQQLKTILS